MALSDTAVVRLSAYAVAPASMPPAHNSGRDVPERMTVELLRLTLADGSEGVAAGLSGWRGAAAGRLVAPAASIAGRVIGRDAAQRVALLSGLLDDREDDGLPEVESLVDIALWDAWGRHLGVPVWQMLGGYRERIPAYASTAAHLSIDAYLDDVRRAQAMGYRAVKFHMNGDPAFDLELVETVAAAFGGTDLSFMVDLEQCYSFDDAVRLGCRLADLPFHWMEAPLPDTDLDAYVELNRAVGVDVLAAGNTLVGLDAWADGLARGAWSRLRCDACNAGGITTLVRALALGWATGTATEVQSYGFAPSQVANLHVMLGVPGCTWFEHPLPAGPFDYGAVNSLRLDAEGRVAAPDGPGLGLEMDWERIEADALLSFDSDA